MTWISPSVDRAYVPGEGDESSMLAAFLEFHRETLLWKCSGLSGEQLASRPVPSSAMSLLGLLRHMTDVERYWFRDVVGREDVPTVYWDNPGRDSDFDDVDASRAEQDYLAFVAELEHCRRVQASVALDTVHTRRPSGERVSHRWVMVHMIEEYARHNGHADLFREAIDGEVGE